MVYDRFRGESSLITAAAEVILPSCHTVCLEAIRMSDAIIRFLNNYVNRAICVKFLVLVLLQACVSGGTPLHYQSYLA